MLSQATAVPPLKVQVWSIARLIPYARNPKDPFGRPGRTRTGNTQLPRCCMRRSWLTGRPSVPVRETGIAGYEKHMQAKKLLTRRLKRLELRTFLRQRAAGLPVE
jgi:hypothetical protein